MAALGSQVSVRMAGSRPALRARSVMEPASRRVTSSDRTSCRKSAWGMLFWRARVSRSGKVAVSLPSLRDRRVALRSGPSGSVSGDMGGFLPLCRGWGRVPRAGGCWLRLLPAAGRSGLAGAGGPGRPGRAGAAGRGRAASCGGRGIEAALVVTFETELLLGVLGAGLPGAGEGLDRADLGSGRGGLGVALAGGVGADVVVLGAGVSFGLPGPADLSAGVLAGLGGFGERGVPPGAGGVPVA